MTARPKLLYASPLPPQQSGISYYSLNLLDALASEFDISLLTEDIRLADPRLAARFPVLNYRRDQPDWDAFPHKIYNIGNNPFCHAYIYEAALRHPGLVVQHDAVIYYLTMGYYMDRPEFYERIYQIGGPAIIATIRELRRAGTHLLHFQRPAEHPLNAELVNSGNAFMTHSRYALRQVLASARAPVQARQINFVRPLASHAGRRSRAELLAHVGLPADATLVTSIGFVSTTKLNGAVCRAVQRVNRVSRRKLHYVMVGEGNSADSYRGEYIRVTGFVDHATFEDYLVHSDLVVNLRYPSMGETSAALLDAMAHARPCIVSDDAWFSELPDNVVLKVPAQPEGVVEDVLYDTLRLLPDRQPAFARLGEAAAEYVSREHAPQPIARQLGDYLHELAGSAPSR